MSARPSKSLRILLADDHAVLRETLHEMLSRQPDINVVGEAADGLAAVRMAKRLLPDILLLDITMPKLDGVEATRRIKLVCPAVRVLALTAHETPALLDEVRQAGASGYVTKHTDIKRLLFAIRRVARGGVYFEPRLMTQAVTQHLSGPESGTSPFVNVLSERETQVLRLLASGLTAKEVAAKLKVGTKSVETYKARLMEKLGLNSRVELMRYARTHGLS